MQKFKNKLYCTHGMNKTVNTYSIYWLHPNSAEKRENTIKTLNINGKAGRRIQKIIASLHIMNGS